MDTFAEGMGVLIIQDYRDPSEYGIGGSLQGKKGIYLGMYLCDLDVAHKGIERLVKVTPGSALDDYSSLERCLAGESDDQEVNFPNPLIAIPVADTVAYIWGIQCDWMTERDVDFFRQCGLQEGDIIGAVNYFRSLQRQSRMAADYRGSQN